MKIFYVLPHCSTGGMPQYVLKQVQSFEEEHKITVFEVENLTDLYIVQRKQFKNLVQLNGNIQRLLDYIEQDKPDVIHFHEVPESFIPEKFLKLLYKNDRNYNIVVTAHSNSSGRHSFRYLPDELVAVSNWQEMKFKTEFPKEISIDKWVYPIEDLKPLDNEKKLAKKRLNLDEAQKHILNVGLFTPNKNQGELFEIARKNPQNIYHFVGNQAPNFQQYWKPLMQNKPKNCIVWGERDDVNTFYKACDEFYFTSKWELFPICIREALSYNLPIKMYKLETYLNDYDNNPLISFI